MASAKSSARLFATPSAKTAAAVSLAALMAACATAPTPGPGPVTPPPGPSTTPDQQVETRDGVTPPFMRGRQIVRVGLLLPFRQRPQDATAIYNAAELALFELGNENTLLIPRDSGADAASATATARALLADGADIIIGPVSREGVTGAAAAARSDGVPMIGLSSDRAVAGNGVYLLSFQLEDEIARLVSYAADQNIRSIALLAPSNEYGRRVESALRAEAAARGVTVAASQIYARTETDATAAANALSATLRTRPAQGIVIAENGAPLRAIGTALVQSGLDTRQVRLMGTSVWAGEAEREPSLAGGWYVAPDPSARVEFENRYRAAFGEAPGRLASLGYDAVALAALLSRERGADGFTPGAFENREGFAGSDGLFRFGATGAVERGLAIIQVGANTNSVVDAAPRRFPESGT